MTDADRQREHERRIDRLFDDEEYRNFYAEACEMVTGRRPWSEHITDHTGALFNRVVALEAEQLTIAIRVCADCRQLIEPNPVEEWRGIRALPGESWCISHGKCDKCQAVWERAVAAEAKRRPAA